MVEGTCGVLCAAQVMPYVTLCAQKAAYLEKLLAPLNRSVKAMYGGLGGTSITPGETGVPKAAAVPAPACEVLHNMLCTLA
jgi:hypothetical protein